VRVAFVGLGVMGRPMVRRLLDAGHQVVVAGRSPGPVEELVAAGAQAASSPRSAAAGADVLLTMLPDSPEVLEVLAGPEGALAALPVGALAIDMSTVAPETARHLAAEGRERGIAVLDAPVSGGDVAARDGTLAAMVGGAEADFERARPLLEVLCERIVLVGANGSGQVVKACNQIVVALTIEALAEALTLGEAAGIDAERILDVLGGGLAANRFMQVRRDNLLNGTFEPGFRVDLHRKDLRIALRTAAELGVDLPVTPLVEQLMGELSDTGRGDLDHSALLVAIKDRRSSHQP
jgi:2-hydroxy-3-oxopropionate reductase